MAPATSPTAGRHGTLIDMPGKGTRNRTIRVDLDLWTRAGEAAESAGTDRATVIKEFLRWYVGEPGAKIPELRDLPASSDSSDVALPTDNP